ncbi:MAG: translation initiation factor IF-3 [Candidatus Peribacteraceae bacterium]|nr:translation initiation factor IF-3 [Candidatus Peribacteraceae bacterium]
MLFAFPLIPLRQRQRFDSHRKEQERRPRVNDQIRVPEVMLVDEEGVTEVLPTAAALERARSRELDLIEVSPKAQPPVVKIGEFGHYLYQLQKKEKKQRSHSKQVEVKMLRFGFRTEKHDLDRLADRAREFLAERHLVKFNVRLRGRELANKEYAVQKLRSVLAGLKDDAEVEQDITRQGTQFIAIVRPKR